MLHDVRQLLVSRYGEFWLNSVNNQNGIAQDLAINERDAIRISRKFGIAIKNIYVTDETEVVATYEVVTPVSTLLDLDAVFYNWWGHRASENICVIQREIADDEIIYHFITGTPTHGHSGRIVLVGRRVQNVIHKRWAERLMKLQEDEAQPDETASSADTSA